MTQKPTYEKLEQKIKELEKEVLGRKQTEQSLDEINICLLGLRGDFTENVNRITLLSGKLFGATCALYNRLDGDMLYSVGQWQTPSDYDPVDKPDGHICYDVIQRGVDDVLIVQNLQNSIYAKTDPNVVRYGLETYVGHSVKCGEEYVGSLCTVFQKEFNPTEDEKRIIGILASAIRLEEERKRAEEALRESEALLRATIESTADGILVVDENGQVTHTNKRFAQMWQIPDELISTREDKKLLDFVLDQLKEPEVFLSKVQVLYKTLDEDIDVLHFKDGRVFERFSSPLVREGQIAGRVWSFSDITVRKRAEEALRESETKYRHLFEMESDAIFLIRNSDGQILEVNTAGVKLYGFSREELFKMKNTDLSAEPDETRKAILKRKREVPTRYHKKKDGTVFPVEITGNHFTWRGEEVHIASIRDIAKRKRAEEALRESEEKLTRSKKMESLGLLAGGVAHDLNNVLSGIVSYPELLLLDMPEDSKLRKPIETMQDSGHRAAAIVQDLITVARGVATTKEPLNVNDLISDYLNSPEFKKLEQFHPTITVKTNLDTDLFNIGGSYVHVRKVVMNLVSNASEAIEDSGNVTISTRNRYIDRPLRGYDDVSIGEYVVLAVSDDGLGISSDDLKRIFEPFYTKKVMGRSGTGLGLAVVWNVVQDHKGYIDVTTDENGTAFELYFPITREEISGQELSIPIKDFKGCGERILVVDDVESQREISCKMLNTLGYKTQAVPSGEEAIEYLKENTVDLILLDMIMDPGINGRETYERIIKIHPQQKAIIVSGFAETDDVKETQKLGAGQYINKPLILEKVGIAVRDELNK